MEISGKATRCAKSSSIHLLLGLYSLLHTFSAALENWGQRKQIPSEHLKGHINWYIKSIKYYPKALFLGCTMGLEQLPVKSMKWTLRARSSQWAPHLVVGSEEKHKLGSGTWRFGWIFWYEELVKLCPKRVSTFPLDLSTITSRQGWSSGYPSSRHHHHWEDLLVLFSLPIAEKVTIINLRL